MDPLSITLSVIGAAKLAWKGALETKEFIDGIKGAPAAVTRLSQDLAALYTILGLLHSYLGGLNPRKQSKRGRQLAELVDLPLKNCINAYTDITLLIRPFIKPSGNASTSKWKGIKWHFRDKEVVALQTVLISYKATLEVAVGIANLTNASHEIREVKNEVKNEVRNQIKGLKRYLDAEQESLADIEFHGSATGTDYNYAILNFLKDTDSVIQDTPLGLFLDEIESCEDDDEEACDSGSDRSGPLNLGGTPPVPGQSQHASRDPPKHPEPVSDFKVRALCKYGSLEAGDLSFPAGQIITVTDAEDEEWYDGWYTDQYGDRRDGIFPKNFVSDPLPEHTPFLNGACHCRRHDDAKHINGIIPTGERMRATADFDTDRASEISVRKGDIVANIARIAPLWWLATNSNNECGFVPAWRLAALSDHEADSSNVEDPIEGRTRHADVFTKWRRPAAQPARTNAAPITKEPEVCATAGWDYEAEEDNELSVREGEKVTIIHGPEMDADWWFVKNQNGETGFFPSNYLELLDGYKVDETRGIIQRADEPVWTESFAAWSGKNTEATVDPKDVDSASSTIPGVDEPAWKDVFAVWSRKQDTKVV